MTSTNNLATLNIELKKDYAIVQIDNGKVNAITTQLLTDLKDTFLNLDKDESVKGVILTGRPHCFSTGIDIVTIAKSDIDGLKLFWVEFLGALQAMIRFSKPYVAAITGYAPAGGTMLACTADYRIMGKGDKHKIGMHEFRMSLQIPEVLCDIYAYTIGEKRAWEAVQKAQLFSSDAAMEIVKRIRAAVGENFILIYRIAAMELMDKGSSWEEVVTLAKAIEKVGINIMSTHLDIEPYLIITIEPTENNEDVYENSDT